MFVFIQLLLMDSALTESEELTEQGKPHISPRIVQEAICVLTCVPGIETDSVEAEKLAQELLVLANHSLVGKLCRASVGKYKHENSAFLSKFFLSVTASTYPDLWVDLLHKMKIDPAEFINKHFDDFLPVITSNSSNDQVSGP